MQKQIKQWMVILMVSLIPICGATASSKVMIPETVTHHAMGEVQVALRDVDTTAKQLVFEIRGDNVTQIPRGLEIQFTFDTSITSFSVPTSAVPITVDTSVVGQAGTLFHVRSPFAPPLPWAYTVVIEVAALPKTGQLKVGTEPSQVLTFHLPPTPDSLSSSPAS